jgi:hypothetical protein
MLDIMSCWAQLAFSRSRRPEVDMLRFRHNEKLAIFQKLIIASERDQSRDEDRHKMLLRLLADEEAKDKPLDS